MKDIELISKLTEAFGPPGFEEEIVDIIIKEMDGFRYEVDQMNNLYIYHPMNKPGQPTIMLDAHTDEVGFMVHSINDNGTLNFINLGGWVPTNIPAHEVWIKDSKGRKHLGITTSTPPHFMTPEQKDSSKLSIESMTIDLGTSTKKETEEIFEIQIGDPVAPKVGFSFNEATGTMLSKALDNRLGCAAVIEVLKALKDVDTGFNIVGAFATQEEMGLRGAAVTAETIKPDYAIVFEGTPADDLNVSASLAQAVLNKGTQIRHLDSSYLANRRFVDLAKEIAESHNIKYQSAVRRGGGTNAGRIHLTGKAVPVLVMGVPSRFIHTHYGYASINDFRSTVNLGLEILKNFDPERMQYKFK